jgi:hypothetical protein
MFVTANTAATSTLFAHREIRTIQPKRCRITVPESITDWLIYVVFNVACFFAPFLALLPDYSRSDAPTPVTPQEKM